MTREFHEALLLYLDHCEARGHFVAHPLSELSEVVDRDWHLRDENGLIAIVTKKGNVGCMCTRHAMSAA